MKKVIYLFMLIVLFMQAIAVYASETRYGDLTVSINSAVIQYEEFNIDLVVENNSDLLYSFQPVIACYNNRGNFVGLYGLSGYAMEENQTLRISEMVASGVVCDCISQIKIMLFSEYLGGSILCDPVECSVENYGHSTDNCEVHKEIYVTKIYSQEYLGEGVEFYPEEGKIVCNIPIWNESVNQCKINLEQFSPYGNNVYCDQFTIEQGASGIKMEFDMQNFSGGEYQIYYTFDDGTGMSHSLNYFTYDDLDYFFQMIANGQIFDYEQFFSTINNFDLFSGMIEDIYYKYYGLEYQKRAFERVNYMLFTYSDEFKQAVFEAYALSVIECSVSTSVICDLLSTYANELRLNLTEFNALSENDRNVVVNKIKNSSILYVADLKVLIEQAIDDIKNSSPGNIEGGVVSGGGRICLSYDFVKKLNYEVVEITDDEKGLSENVICITGVKDDQNLSSNNIVIPKEIDNMRVAQIGAGAFSSLCDITCVAIPETVNYVAEDAFSSITPLQRLYLYSDETEILDAFEDCISENTRVICFENSGTYTHASKLNCIVEPIYEFEISVAEHEEFIDSEKDCYKDIIFTDNNEEVQNNIHLIVRDNEGNRLITATAFEGEVFSFSYTGEVFISAYLESVGKVYDITDTDELFTGTADVFEYVYEPSEIIYDGINRSFKIKPEDKQNNNCTPYDLNTAVIALYNLSAQKYVDFYEIKNSNGQAELMYILPEIDNSNDYMVNCNGFVQSIYITSDSEVKTILNEINSGLISVESAYNIFNSLGVFSDSDISYYFSGLNDNGIMSLLYDSQGMAKKLTSYGEFLRGKLFLLCISSSTSDFNSDEVGKLLYEKIDADYSLLDAEQKTELFESVYGLCFDNTEDLEEYIANYILKKQEYIVTFVDFYGNETVVVVDGLSAATAPDIEAELIGQDDRKYIFDGWDKEFATVSSDITVRAVYLPEYNVVFMVDNKIHKIVSFTSKKPITEPNVPERLGYNGRWEEYKLGEEDIIVNAVYNPYEYYLEFFANDVLVERVLFTIENTQVKIPEVPVLTGYEGYWGNFTINEEFILNGDFEIKAYYLSTDCELRNVNGCMPLNDIVTLPDVSEDKVELNVLVNPAAQYEFIGCYLDENGKILIDTGENSFNLKILSENGNEKIYTIFIYRMSNECELLSIENGVVNYDAVIMDSVSHNTEYINIIPSISELASWELYSDKELTNKINQITLSDGINYAWLKIIAENGQYKIYRVEIVRTEQLTAVESTILSGYYLSGRSYIELYHEKENVEIYYTTDGTLPDENSMLYSEPIILNSDVIISAVAICEGYDNSVVQTFVYKIAKEISDIKIIQLYGNSAVIGYSQISGAQNTLAYVEYSDGKASTGEEIIDFNYENNMLGITNLRENVYARVVIVADYLNGSLSSSSEWFLTQTPVSTECNIVSIANPNVVIDNDLGIVKNFKVANKNKQISIDLTVSEGAYYAVYPSQYSKTPYENNIVTLNEGNNIFFIKVTASDNITSRTYKTYIYRNTKAITPEIIVENGYAMINGTPGAKIYYSTDKSVPNIMTSIEYIDKFEVCDGMLIRAICVDSQRDEVSDECTFKVSSISENFIIDIIDVFETNDYCKFNLNIVSEPDAIPKAAKLIVAQYKKDYTYLGAQICGIKLENTDNPVDKKINKLDDEVIFKIMLWENDIKQNPIAFPVTY